MQHPPKIRQRKTRSRRTILVCLLAAAVLLTAFLLLMPVLFPKPVGQFYPDPEIELTYETLDVSDPALLSSITVSHAAGDSYTLRYQEGRLLLERDGQLEDINDSLCQDLLEAATTIAVENVVTRDAAEVAEHLGDMGLEPPETIVTVRYGDGRENVLQIGAQVPMTTYSYYRWSGDPGVYMCDAGIAEVFALEEQRLLPVQQPTLVSDLVESVEIVNQNGTMEIQLTAQADGSLSAQLTQPLRYPVSKERTTSLMTVLDGFALGSLLGPLDAENTAAYGLDAPVCVVEIHQQEGLFTHINDAGELVVSALPAQQLRLSFGPLKDEYFYPCAYEGNVYLVSRFLVEPLISAAAHTWLTQKPADMGGAFVTAVEVKRDGQSHLLTLTRTERVLENNKLELDADGNVVYDVTAQLDGNDIPTAQAQTLVDRLAAMGVSGSVDHWSPNGAQPRWQLKLTTEAGDSRMLTAYRLDAFSDALSVDGTILHYCYVEALDTALGDLIP